MIKYILSILVFLFSYNLSYSYENQWFRNYKESGANISFKCDKQCFLVTSKKDLNNYFQINWNIKWNWVIWYWFFNWQQIIPWEFIEIKTNQSLDKKFLFKDLAFYDQLVPEIPILLVIQWNIESNDFSFNIWKTTFSENISQAWDNFWKIETLTPYSINLRYWVKINWTSIISIFYILFFIIFIILLFIKKYRTKESIIILWLIFFMFIWFRNLYTYWNIVNTWLKSYTFQEYENKTFFDLWDYLVFTDKIRKEINLDTEKNKKCTIYAESFQDWPFVVHWNLYLKPCKLTNDIKTADYLIYYKKKLSKELNAKLLINFNNSYLLKNNK